MDVNTETVTIPTDSTGTEGEQNPPDGSVESATETVTTYTYSFGYSGTAGEYTVYGDPKVTNNPENETVALYTISLPASGKYILRNAEGKILKNDLNVADGEITADMVWDAGENAWVSGDKSISVSLNIPEAGAEQYPYVTVNGTDYKAYAVTVSTNYELKRLAQDAVYSTTDPTDDA